MGELRITRGLLFSLMSIIITRVLHDVFFLLSTPPSYILITPVINNRDTRGSTKS
jgi:hypothetical protein